MTHTNTMYPFERKSGKWKKLVSMFFLRNIAASREMKTVDMSIIKSRIVPNFFLYIPLLCIDECLVIYPDLCRQKGLPLRQPLRYCSDSMIIGQYGEFFWALTPNNAFRKPQGYIPYGTYQIKALCTKKEVPWKQLIRYTMLNNKPNVMLSGKCHSPTPSG